MLCAVGDLIEDIVVQLHDDIQTDTDTASTITRRRGGSAANVAYFAAAIDGTSRFIGCVGSDPIGDALVARLERHGVQVRGERQGRSGSIVVLSTRDGRRSMLTDRGDSTQLQTFDESWLDDVTTMHLPLYSFSHPPLATTAHTIARIARDRGLCVSIDLSSVTLIAQLGRTSVLGLVDQLSPDVLFCTRDEADASGISSASRAGARLVVVKDGPRPVEVFGADVPDRQYPTEPVSQVVDATGAGDAFAAGFLSALARRASIADCVYTAQQLAARVLVRAGATLEDE